MHNREWPAGSIVRDRNGFRAMLLAPVWAQFAWICYDGHANPHTVLAYWLTLVSLPGPVADLVASGGIVDAPDVQTLHAAGLSVRISNAEGHSHG